MPINGCVLKRRTSNLTERAILHVGLARPFEHVTKLLYERADPGSSFYGQWLKQNEAEALISPSSRESIARVRAAFGGDCTPVRDRRDWLRCTVPLSLLERRLQCVFYDCTHALRPGKTLTRAKSYHLGLDLRDIVDVVVGITGFPKPRRTRRKSSKSSSGHRAVDEGKGTPNRVRALWRVNAKGDPANGNMQEIASFEANGFDPADLRMAWSLFNTSTSNVSAVGNNIDLASDEGSLDIQHITGVNQGTATLFTLVPYAFEDGLMPWLLGIGPGAPFVHSISYSSSELEEGVGEAYLTRMDQEFQLLGLQGHTFVAASGDNGVGCVELLSGNEPMFPGSSPHVLAVGGVTELGGTRTPRSWSDSGGGFSSVFPDAPFMKAAHQQYLTHGPSLPPLSFFNSSGRGYPDVSSVAGEGWFVLDGGETLSDGTSFAAPQVAAIISLLNDIRISQKKPVLGFVNPLIYNVSAAAFVTIATGPRNSYLACQGFAPSEGWSPIVGFGGINFPAMAAIVKNLK